MQPKQPVLSSPSAVPADSSLATHISTIWSALAPDQKNGPSTTDMDSANSNPALKLKIKLPAPPIPKDDGVSKDADGNPLKIVIKKADVGSSTSASATDRVPLTAFRFPDVPGGTKRFKEACAMSADQLPTLRETDLNLISEELETMKKQLKDLSSSMQGQMEALENWKQQKGGSPLLGKRKERDVRDYFSKVGPSKPGSAGVINKRQKTDSSSDEDDPSYQKKESSSDDEIDVVDVEDSQSTTEVEMNGSSKKKRAGKVHKKGLPATPVTKGNHVKKQNSQIINKNRQQQQQQAQQQKNKPTRLNTRDRNRNRQSISGYSSEEEALAKRYKTNFWQEVDPYFNAFVEDDEKFIAPQTLDPSDPALVIPPLGRNYKEEWEEEDGEEARNASRYLKSVPQTIIMENGENKIIPSCGDLTSRILSALIEENIVPMEMKKTLENGTAFPTFLKTLPQDKDTSPSCIPIEKPASYDYSLETFVALEERIKLELKSVGLLDDSDFDTSQREDDEICIELRKLQKQLQERVNSNNVVRSKISAMLPSILAQEDAERKERQAVALNVEKTYQKMMLQQRKKKRKPTRQEVT